MEKKSFDFTMPKFMAKRKTPVKQNSENDTFSPFGSSVGEVEDATSFGAKCSSSIPSFLQQSFSPARFPGTTQPRSSSPTSSTIPEFLSTPRRKLVNHTDLSDEQQSPYHSLPTYGDGGTKRCSTPFMFPQTRSSQTVGKHAQLYNQGQGQHGDSPFEEAFTISESCNSLQFGKAPVARQKLDMDDQGMMESTRRRELTLSQFNEEETTFVKQVHSLTDQFLAAAKKVQSNLIGENNSLKRELNIAEQQITNLEMQIEKLETNQSMVINSLSVEKENLQEEVRVSKEQVSISENQLKELKYQFEEKTLQLENTEESLKTTLENVMSLEKLARSSEDQLSNLQIQFQVVSKERTEADERSNLLSGEVKSLQDEMDSLQLKMNEAENNFRSTLCDYQSELEKEKASHKNTEIVLSDTCKTFDQVKTELENCAQKCLKIEESFQTSAKDKGQLEEEFNDLNNKYRICEQSLISTLNNASSLESSLSTIETKLEQLRQQMETTSAELAETRKKAMDLEETNESLHSKLETLRNLNNDCEKKLQSDLSNAKQSLEREIEAHDETKLRWDACRTQLEENQSQRSLEISEFQSAKEMWNDQKSFMEAQMNELQVKLVATEQNLEMTQEESLNAKQMWNDQKSFLESQMNELQVKLVAAEKNLKITHEESLRAKKLLNDQKSFMETQMNELQVKLVAAEKKLKITHEEFLSAKKLLNDQKSFMEAQMNELQVKLDAAEKNLKITNEESLSAKEMWNDQKSFMEAEVNELQAKLVAAEQKLEITNEESLTLERQLNRRLELSNREISAMRIEARENSNRNNKLQALLDDMRAKSALSEDELKSEFFQCRKDLDTLRKTHLETLRNLAETRDQLSSSESTCEEAVRDQSKLQTEITNLLKDKVESEKAVECQKNNLSAQVLSLEAVKADNSTLIEALSAYEEYTKGMLKNFRLVLTEHKEAMTSVNQLSTEIKSLQTQIDVGRKHIEVTDKDFKGLNTFLNKFLEDKEETLVEVQKRFMSANSGLVSLSEALKKVTSERSEFERVNRIVTAEKEELEKQIKTLKGNVITSNSVQEKLLDRNVVLEGMVTSSSQQILNLQNQIQSIDAERILSREVVKNLKNENTGLKTQLDSLRQEINISEQKFKEDLEALKKQLEFERTSRKNIQSQKDNVKTSGDNLEALGGNIKSCLNTNTDRRQTKLVTFKDGSGENLTSGFSRPASTASDGNRKNPSTEWSNKVKLKNDNNLRTKVSELQPPSSVTIKEESPQPMSNQCDQSGQASRKNTNHNLDSNPNQQPSALSKTIDKIHHSAIEAIVDENKDEIQKLLNKENVQTAKRSSLATPRKMSLKSLAMASRNRPRNAAIDDSSKSSPNVMADQLITNQRETNESVQAQNLEPKKLALHLSPVRAPSAGKQDTPKVDDIASQQIEVQTVENFGDSFSVHNVEPVRRTYARKRTSTNAQNPSNRPSSANATKKTRRTTK